MINDTTYQTINRNLSPVNHNAKSLVFLRKGLRSPERKEAHELLLRMNSDGLYSSPKFPKAKPFFEQAYIGKSIVESFSQMSPRENRKDVQKGSEKFNPISPSRDKVEESRPLPPLKPKRFNEEVPDDVSTFSKGSKLSRIRLRLHSPTRLKQIMFMNRMHEHMSGQPQAMSKSISQPHLLKPLAERPSNPRVTYLF